MKAALAVAVIVGLPIPIVAWASARAMQWDISAGEMSLGFRVTLYLGNWYIRFLPVLAAGCVAAAALAGGLTSKGSSVSEERLVLLGWTLFSVLDSLLAWSMWTLAPQLAATGWGLVLLLAAAVSFVACIATVVVATHLHGRIRSRLHTRVQAWHVAAASVALALLGPAMFLPPAWVWLRAGSIRGELATP